MPRNPDHHQNLISYVSHISRPSNIFHQNSLTTSWVILLTDKLTDKGQNKITANYLGRVKNTREFIRYYKLLSLHNFAFKVLSQTACFTSGAVEPEP